jgi:NAD(P)-dependent dehydrogenase (short-subunit alcohol dehydrogenase family)
MKDLKGKGAFVTGAASGIGLGMALALADEGADVVLADIEEGRLAAARDQVAAKGVKTATVRLDVSNREAVYAAAQEAQAALGKIHILCNNAGVSYAGVPLDAVPDKDWDWVVAVNLMGVVNGLQAFLPLIEAHGEGGHVVNTASIGGHHVMPGWGRGLYVTTKYAVVGLSESLLDDLQAKHIGVSVLCPAAVNTDIYQGGRNRPERFGGPYRRPDDHPMIPQLKAGMDPYEVGRWVVRAIEDDEFYIFTHPDTKALLEGRFQRILEAYDWADRVRPDVEKTP